jgi:ABC-type multidrug transport system ATPase subunit
MIEAHELTKRYGDTTAVHSLSFTIAIRVSQGVA